MKVGREATSKNIHMTPKTPQRFTKVNILSAKMTFFYPK